MQHRLVFLFALAATCAAQGQYRNNAQTAAILSDARYLSGDGTFGSAYTQEDGVQFKEESDPDGNRRGSYSYVDPSGQRRTITYTAGKNGFQATGDHLPVPPPAPAPVAPQPQYQPQYQPQHQPQYQPQPATYNNPGQYDDGQYREEYNNPNYQSRSQPAPTNPGQYSYSFGSTPAPQYPQAPQNPLHNQQPFYTTTTPAPHRFFPPGKLNLNRTPDGFSYTFNKN